MEINFIQNEDGVIFYDFTKICTIQKKYKTNTSQESKKIPSEYIYKTGVGRNSRTYISKEGLFLWYKTKRDINQDLKIKINEILGVKDDEVKYSLESLFINMLIEFLKEIRKDLKFEKQFKIDKYNVDLLINNKLVIEFNEFHHNNKKDYDEKREELIKSLGYRVVNINANSNFGKSIGIVFKNMLINNI